MQLRIQQIFQTLEPYKVAADLGIPIQERGGQFFIQHPQHAEIELCLTSSEFISCAPDCNFVAGDIFDFLSLKLGNYELAVKHVFDNYQHLAQNPYGHPIETLQTMFVQDLQLRRDQFQNILRLRQNLLSSNSKLLGVAVYLRKAHISSQHTWKMIYAATGQELNTLFQTQLDQQKGIKFDDDDSYLIFPYFSDYHTFSQMVFRSTANDQTRTIVLHPSKYSYFGLHSCLPGITTRVFETPIDAASSFSYLVDHGHSSVGCIQVGFNYPVHQAALQLPNAIFMLRERTDFDLLVRNRAVFRDFFISDKNNGLLGADEVKPIPWIDYLVDTFQRMLNGSDQLTPKISAFIASLKVDRQACESILALLTQLGKDDLREKIKNQVYANQTFKFQNLEIIETANGYVARKSGSPGETIFTNFVIRLDRNIWFEETQELFHSGRVLIAGQEFDICVPQKFLVRPNEVARLATSAVYSANRPAAPVPIISDTTYRGRLCDVLSTQTANRPRFNGVKKLGWNFNRTVFVTPTWQAKISGIEPTSHIPYPQSDFLSRFYQFRDFNFSTNTESVNPQINSLIALVVAQLARHFVRLPCPPIKVLRSVQMLNALSGIFLAFGQRTALELNTNKRAGNQLFDPSNLSGLPVFALCTDDTVLKDLNYPALMVSESGVSYYAQMDNALLKQIYTLSYSVFSRLTVALLRNNSVVHQFLGNTTEVQDLILEGKKIVENLCGIKSFPIFRSDLPSVETLLSGLTVEEIPSHFKFDLGNQKVTLGFRRLNVKRRDILEDLKRLDPEVRMKNEHYLEIAADPMLEFLTKFYGRKITLFHSPDNTDPTSGQDGSSQLAIS